MATTEFQSSTGSYPDRASVSENLPTISSTP
eukprot:SAG11_NODE_31013_length_295_cov_1.545918_1_plen_30_part_10